MLTMLLASKPPPTPSNVHCKEAAEWFRLQAEDAA